MKLTCEINVKPRTERVEVNITGKQDKPQCEQTPIYQSKKTLVERISKQTLTNPHTLSNL